MIVASRMTTGCMQRLDCRRAIVVLATSSPWQTTAFASSGIAVKVAGGGRMWSWRQRYMRSVAIPITIIASFRWGSLMLQCRPISKGGS